MSDQRNPESSEEAIQVGQRDIFEKFGILFTDVKEGRASSEMTLDAIRWHYVPSGGYYFRDGFSECRREWCDSERKC